MDEPHHGVLLLLGVIWQLQDPLLPVFDGLPQLLHIRGQEQALQEKRGIQPVLTAPGLQTFPIISSPTHPKRLPSYHWA